MNRLQKLYDYSATDYDKYMERTGNFSLQKDLVKKLLPFLDINETIIDIGAGTGNIIHLLQSSSNFRKIFAADFSQTMLKIAKKKTKAICVLADAENLPFGEFSLDNVICCYSLNFFRDAELAIKEIIRICKKKIILIDKDMYYDHTPKTEMGKFWHPVDYNKIKGLIESYGFECVKIRVKKDDIIFALILNRK